MRGCFPSVTAPYDMWTGWGNLCTRRRSPRRCPRPHPCSPQVRPRGSRGPSSGPGPATDDAREVLDLAVRGRPGPHVLLDLEDAVAGRRVVAPAERVADLDQGLPAALTHQVHRDVAGGRERPGAVRRDQVLDGQPEVAGAL